MPLGDFDLLSNALELHMFCTGSSDCIGYKHAQWIYDNLVRRLVEWHKNDGKYADFDNAVKALCEAACFEYKDERADFIKRNNDFPENLDCWQDGLFEKTLSRMRERGQLKE